jgi:hypothetical protein
MTPEERYLFDLQGYITVPNALNKEELSELNKILEGQIAESPKPDDKRFRFVGMLGWGAAYRRLIDNPRLTPYLEELIHPQFRLDHDYTDVIRSGVGPIGATLHGGGTPFDSCCFFNAHNGRMYNGLLVVAYNLKDVNPGDGGFACVPGSHKSNYPLPTDWHNLDKPHPMVERVTGPAGTAILFTEALTHGTLPWTGKNDRRTLFYKYSPPSISWAADYYDTSKYSDLTEREKAILEAPNARYNGRTKR